MEKGVSVSAIFKHGFGMELDTLSISDGRGQEIHLSKEQWEEVHATLNGKRKTAHSGIKEGSFYPETYIVWN